jgi:hypothetical protein
MTGERECRRATTLLGCDANLAAVDKARKTEGFKKERKS